MTPAEVSPPVASQTARLKLLAVTALVVVALFSWEGNKGFNLRDEGFLWYGADRVLQGDVPMRDFMAYDPGRYYWSAAWMCAWGDRGMMGLRAAEAVFQTLGLFAGLSLIARGGNRRDFGFWLLSAVTLAIWMFPRHKLFDVSLSMVLIGVLAFLVENPTNRRYFLAGLCVGLAAVFGRNHGVYGAAGSAGVMLWLSANCRERQGLLGGCAWWAAGVVVGFCPVLVMAPVVPGFAVAFWESIRLLAETRSTNIPLPVPWPWRADLAAVPFGEAARRVLLGLFFIATAAFGVLSIGRVVWQRFRNRQAPPALVAAACLAFPYAHYAYSRADAAHLAMGIFPLLVGCLALLAARKPKAKWPPALLLCAASIWLALPAHPGWQCHAGQPWVEVEVSGTRLLVDRETVGNIELLRSLARQFAPDGRSFVATPFWPGAYPLLARKSATWEIYALFPRSAEFERAEIERIRKARPGFVIVCDTALDGRDELRFCHTHPLTYQFIADRFERVTDARYPAYQIYREKGA